MVSAVDLIFNFVIWIVIIGCLIMIISLIWTSFKNYGVEEVVHPLIIEVDRKSVGFDSVYEYGSSDNGVVEWDNAIAIKDEEECVDNAELVNGKCICKTSFFGPRCLNMSYSSNYLPIGYYKPINFSATTNTSYNDVNLSFSTNGVDINSCTSKCDDDALCTGVYYEDRVCSILHDDIKLDENVIEPRTDLQPTLYIKKNLRPIIPKVFISPGNNLPELYWRGALPVVSVTNKIEQRMLYTRDLQYSIQNDILMKGVWSTVQLTEKDIDDILSTGNVERKKYPGELHYIDLPASTSYIVRPNILQIHRKSRKIYVYYISNN